MRAAHRRGPAARDRVRRVMAERVRHTGGQHRAEQGDADRVSEPAEGVDRAARHPRVRGRHRGERHPGEITAHQLIHRFYGGRTGWIGKHRPLTDEQAAALRAAAPPAVPPGPPAVPPGPPAVPPGPPAVPPGPPAVPPGPPVVPPGPPVVPPGPPVVPPGPPAVPPGPPVVPPGPPVVPPGPPVVPPGPTRIAPDDDLLVAALKADGRVTYPQLQRLTGRSESSVKRHVAALLGSGALYLDTDYDTARFGFTTAAMLWITVAPGALDKVGRAMAGHPRPPASPRSPAPPT
ncbi:hypothetical protein ACOBQB_04475 [Streptomyces sp. G5(2025)]|uniref:hypothetical protein n=1 Tax=Streptomyces sp. G5(2025) TaxID=3406628 RepID=UPI003C21CA6C